MEDKRDDFAYQAGNPDRDRRADEEREPAHDGSAGTNHADAPRPSFYYAYGPYKPSKPEEIREERTGTAEFSRPEPREVELAVPRPMRTVSITDVPESKPVATWMPQPQKKRSSFKTAFTAFLAGAVLVFGLMYASDRLNLFSGSDAQAAGGGSGPVSVNTEGVSAAKLNQTTPANIAEIFKQASPAVVKIETYVRTQRSNSMFSDPYFRQFFEDFFGYRQDSNRNEGGLQQNGIGSGFFFDKSGYILTNEHVVSEADEIRVYVEGYKEPFKATLLGHSVDLDLAVLKIEGKEDFPYLPLGSSEAMNVGDWVVAIGNPYGFEHTLTVGVLSAKERPISIRENGTVRNYENLLQTDASINPGNSGGPLLNLNGEVIGINTAVNAQAQGIGFAIPTSTVTSVLQNLKDNVQIPRPYIGVSLGNIEESYLRDLGLDNTDGALVMDVVLGSPAFKAGIKKYDVILSINGEKIKTREELIRKVQASEVGSTVTLGIVRDGQSMEVKVTIGDRNKDEN